MQHTKDTTPPRSCDLRTVGGGDGDDAHRRLLQGGHRGSSPLLRSLALPRDRRTCRRSQLRCRKMEGDLVRITNGKWITRPPSGCPNGHPLGADQVGDAVADERSVATLRRLYRIRRAGRWWRWSRDHVAFPRGWPGLSGFGRHVSHPVCDAPIRHRDHATPRNRGGPTVRSMGWVSVNAATTPRKRRAGGLPLAR